MRKIPIKHFATLIVLLYCAERLRLFKMCFDVYYDYDNYMTLELILCFTPEK